MLVVLSAGGARVLPVSHFASWTEWVNNTSFVREAFGEGSIEKIMRLKKPAVQGWIVLTLAVGLSGCETLSESVRKAQDAQATEAVIRVGDERQRELQEQSGRKPCTHQREASE